MEFHEEVLDSFDVISLLRLYHIVQGYKFGFIPGAYLFPWTKYLFYAHPSLMKTWEGICKEGRVLECGFPDNGSVANRGVYGVLISKKNTPSYKHVSKSNKRYMHDIAKQAELPSSPSSGGGGGGSTTPTTPGGFTLTSAGGADPNINEEYVANASMRGEAFLEPSQKLRTREIVSHALEDAAVTLQLQVDGLRYLDETDRESKVRKLDRSSARLKAVTQRLREECMSAHRLDEIAAVKAIDKRYDLNTPRLLDGMELTSPKLRCTCVVRTPVDKHGFLSWLGTGSYVSFLCSMFLYDMEEHRALMQKLTDLTGPATSWAKENYSTNDDQQHVTFFPGSFRSRHETTDLGSRQVILSPSGVLLFQQVVKCMEKYTAAEECVRKSKGVFQSPTEVLSLVDKQQELPPYASPVLVTAPDMRDVLRAREAQIFQQNPLDVVTAGLQVHFGITNTNHVRPFFAKLQDEIYTLKGVDVDVLTNTHIVQISLDPVVLYPNDFPFQLPPYTSDGVFPDLPPPTDWVQRSGGDRSGSGSEYDD